MSIVDNEHALALDLHVNEVSVQKEGQLTIRKLVSALVSPGRDRPVGLRVRSMPLFGLFSFAIAHNSTGCQGEGEPVPFQYELWAQDDPDLAAQLICLAQNDAVGENCTGLDCRFGDTELIGATVSGWYETLSDIQLQYSPLCGERLWYAELVARDATTSIPSDVDVGTPQWPPFGESQWLDCELECQIYFGDRDVGEPCEHVGRRMSTCRESLLCGVDELCHEPCSLPMFGQLGDLCGFEVGAGPFPCADGLTCVQNRCAVDEPPVDPVDWCQVYIW